MHAFLLTNSDPVDFAKKQNAKIIPFTLQKIENVRELKKLVKFSFSEKTAIVIKDIDNITTEAANAFLKDLEEPTKNIVYVLTASNLNNVLPTIASRCEIVKVLSTKYKVLSTHTNYKDALNIKDRDEAIKFVENYLFYLESNLTHNPQLTTACQTCLTTIKNLKANGNVALQMTNLVVRMNSNA